MVQKGFLELTKWCTRQTQWCITPKPSENTVTTPSLYLKLSELTCPVLTCTRTNNQETSRDYNCEYDADEVQSKDGTDQFADTLSPP